jgi:UDP-N-acetyl-D-mannosaminuronic acid dehydrogenase
LTSFATSGRANAGLGSVGVVGLGYVGITLAASLADVGYRVHGVEVKDSALATLRTGRPHIFEPGLEETYARNFGVRLTVDKELPREALDAYLICVGTPMTAEGVEMRYAIDAANAVAERMDADSLVMLRSTVPVGFTRSRVLPILARDRARPLLAFCPERTIQGKALQELRTLPQIVGGIDERSAERAAAFFAPLAKEVVRVRDLETAEIVKLVCNAHTDLIYGYGNEVARMAEALGLDAWEIIRAANLDYPRPDLSRPGYVGGPCLTKDPYILAHSAERAGYRPELVLGARHLNESMAAAEADRLVRLVAATGPLEEADVLLCGLAYKGRPETDDLRGSPALPIIERLRDQVRELRGFDAVLAPEVIARLGVKPCGLEDGFRGARAVVFVNDHPAHERADIAALARTMRRPALIFDSWMRFASLRAALPSDVTYAALGIG